MQTIEGRLAQLGIQLPAPNPPQGNYLPYQISANIVFIAGQGPRVDGAVVYRGTVDGDRR